MTFPVKPLYELLPLPGVAELRMIERRFQSLFAKMLLQRLSNLTGWHKNHYFTPARHSNTAELSDHPRAFVDWHAPSKKRDVGTIDPTHEYLGIGNPERL
ncbi:hypothetical protein ASC80_14960 [Afipia sp. Root123D2]|nr:hypothetical protein ASC80_14960 [Afipia sp. Root123D2]